MAKWQIIRGDRNFLWWHWYEVHRYGLFKRLFYTYKGARKYIDEHEQLETNGPKVIWSSDDSRD